MPFCRKCGRRLAEYSKICPDCGQSTTAPIVNIKRTQGKNFFPEGEERDTKIVTPPKSPAKVIVAKPAKAAATVKAFIPIKATPVKAFEPPKPVISAKHIIKPKKAKPSKPAAPFTIANARPVAGFDLPKPAPAVLPKRQPPKPVTSTAPVAPPKIVPQPAQSSAPASPVISLKPVTPQKTQVAKHAPIPITPAPVYPPHEIIKSNVSLKEDITSNPQDYERQAFDFDLECSKGHYWAAGELLPVSKGKAYCLKCGGATAEAEA